MGTEEPHNDVAIHSTRRRYLLGFALLVVGSANLTCFGQTITVRLIKATDGSPVARHKVLVAGISGNGVTPEEALRRLVTKPSTPELSLVTDAQGEVQITLPKPAPAYFYVRAVLSPHVWDCICLLRVSTEDAIQKGLLFDSHDGRSRSGRSVRPKAGEITLRLRPNPLWVRVFWPLLVDHPF